MGAGGWGWGWGWGLGAGRCFAIGTYLVLGCVEIDGLGGSTPATTSNFYLFLS